VLYRVDDNRGGAAIQEPTVAYLTPKDVQKQLKIGEKLCYKLLREGAIPCVRLGGLYRIPRKQLEEALIADPRPFSCK
jgi:excisionase family DNA binding protein